MSVVRILDLISGFRYEVVGDTISMNVFFKSEIVEFFASKIG